MTSEQYRAYLTESIKIGAQNILLQNKHELTGSEIQEICDLLWDYREELLKKEAK